MLGIVVSILEDKKMKLNILALRKVTISQSLENESEATCEK